MTAQAALIASYITNVLSVMANHKEKALNKRIAGFRKYATAFGDKGDYQRQIIIHMPGSSITEENYGDSNETLDEFKDLISMATLTDSGLVNTYLTNQGLFPEEDRQTHSRPH